MNDPAQRRTHSTRDTPACVPANLSRRELVATIQARTPLRKKEIQLIVEQMLAVIIEQLAAGRNVELRTFGVFQVRKRAPRTGRNPREPDRPIFIPAQAAVSFRSGQILKKLLQAEPVSPS